MSRGETMRAWRENKGVTRKQLSEATGISVNTIYQAEEKERNLTILNIVAMADVLGLSIDTYIGHQTND